MTPSYTLSILGSVVGAFAKVRQQEDNRRNIYVAAAYAEGKNVVGIYFIPRINMNLPVIWGETNIPKCP